MRLTSAYLYRQQAGPDAKILVVPDGDPRWNHVQDIGDVSAHFKAEVLHFFSIYKDLEPSKTAIVEEWHDRAAAWEAIEAARIAYRGSQ